jgi:hypothetical protein
MKKRSPSPAESRSAGHGAMTGPRVGWIVAGSKPGELRVDYPGNPGNHVSARSIVPFDAKSLERAISEQREVVLFFEENDPRRPLDAILGEVPQGAPVEANVDRKRILLEGKEEVVLRCGKSSITLRPNGKLVIRGAYVETYAEGTNRIKGGVVKIN